MFQARYAPAEHLIAMAWDILHLQPLWDFLQGVLGQGMEVHGVLLGTAFYSSASQWDGRDGMDGSKRVLVNKDRGVQCKYNVVYIYISCYRIGLCVYIICRL